MLTIYQLSDLHFGSEIIPSSNNIIQGFSAHDERIWAALKNHLKKQINKNDNDYLVVIAGDLSQLGDIKSYTLANDLLFENPGSDLSEQYGLQLPRNKVFIVPGNHDAYAKSYFRKNNLRTFNNIFFPTVEDNTIYPTFETIQINGTNYIFMGIDSTYKKNAVSLRKKFGKGKIAKTQLANLSGRLQQVGEDNIRILCMHHCPIIVDQKRERSLMLDNSSDVLSWISKNRIDYVLCGHLHDDFYDILPLNRLIKFLPSKRGLGRIKKKIFKETYLNDYQPIFINGKKAKYIDSIAYHYIKAKYSDILDITKGEFSSIKAFNNYLINRPEYKEFIKDFSDHDNKTTGIIMSGTSCQENAKSNSYLEITIDPTKVGITLSRHKYNKEKKKFTTKQRTLTPPHV